MNTLGLVRLVRSAICWGVGANCFLLLSMAPAVTFTNRIQNFAFSPQSRTINVGDKVVWINMDSTFHSVTGNTASEPVCGNPTFGQGQMCMRVFNTAGTFGYHCIPHSFMTGTIIVQGAPNANPTVSLTNPPSGKVFPAPAQFNLEATASDSDGSVASVRFFSGTTALGTVSNSPYRLLVTNVAAGNYTLTARATDNLGAMATSAPVNVSVVTPAPLRFSAPSVSNGVFAVSYSTTPQLTYVLQAATNLPPTNLPAAWVSLQTNVANANSLRYTEPGVSNRLRRFFRAFIQP